MSIISYFTSLFHLANYLVIPTCSPVIGALSGLFIASFPKVRSMLVNISAGSEEPAPLQWMFDGIYAVGYISKFLAGGFLDTLLERFFTPVKLEFYCFIYLFHHRSDNRPCLLI